MSAYTLYLVRHGATPANLEGRYIGWEEHSLSPEGEEQARRLAQHLGRLPLTAICASDLRRTLQTAAAIAAVAGLPVQPLPGLRELNFGDWSGLTYAEIEARAPEQLQAWLQAPELVSPPGGESLTHLRSRALAALPRQDGAVAVTHGGVIRAVLSQLTGEPFWDFHAPPGSVTTLRWDGVTCLHRPVVLGF